MEQEPESPLLYSTVKRAGYNLALVAHVVFIAGAIIGTVILMAVLLFSALTV